MEAKKEECQEATGNAGVQMDRCVLSSFEVNLLRTGRGLLACCLDAINVLASSFLSKSRSKRDALRVASA